MNNQEQLARARRILNERLLAHWMAAGVTVVDPLTTWVDVDARIEPGARIAAGTQLEGRTTVGAGATVGPGALLRDTFVGAGATILQSVCESAVIAPGAAVGPFAHLTAEPDPGHHSGQDSSGTRQSGES